jgi:excisionase family DNA binding protein
VTPLLLTVEQASQVLAIGRTAVYELISCGRLGSVRIGGSRRIPVAALDTFVRLLINDPPHLEP